MIYACLTWEFAVDTHLLKLDRLQNKVLHTIGKLPKCTPIRELHMALQVLYDYLMKLCRQQAVVIQNMKMQMFLTLEKVKPDTKYKRLKLGGGQAHDRSSD
jgi:hypothetical protein